MQSEWTLLPNILIWSFYMLLGLFKRDIQNSSSFKSIAEAIAAKVIASSGSPAVAGGPDGLSLLLITLEKAGRISA